MRFVRSYKRRGGRVVTVGVPLSSRPPFVRSLHVAAAAAVVSISPGNRPPTPPPPPPNTTTTTITSSTTCTSSASYTGRDECRMPLPPLVGLLCIFFTPLIKKHFLRIIRRVLHRSLRRCGGVEGVAFTRKTHCTRPAAVPFSLARAGLASTLLHSPPPGQRRRSQFILSLQLYGVRVLTGE